MKRYLLLGAAAAGGYALWQALRPKYDFRDKTVLITGGSRAGAGPRPRVRRAGGQRRHLRPRPDELPRGRRRPPDRGTRAVGVQCDVTDRDRVGEFVAVAEARRGPIDVLVNNAGIIGVGPLETMNVGRLRAVAENPLLGGALHHPRSRCPA